eukprot:s558_g20.t1
MKSGDISRFNGAMAVIQPEGQITWGGAVLPQIETLDPRIRKVALERYYLPKLIEDGYARNPVIGRVIAAAETGSQRPQRSQRHTRCVPGWVLHPVKSSETVCVQVSLVPQDGFSLEMSDVGGVPTLSLSLSTKLKIPVSELLQTLMSANGGAAGSSFRQEPESRTNITAQVSQARKVAEGPIAPFKNSPSYADYVASNNWQGYQSLNTLVLSDEKTFNFMEAKFEPIPVPSKIEYTYAKWKEREAKEGAKNSSQALVKPPPNYPAPPAPKTPQKAPPVKGPPAALVAGASPAPPPGLAKPAPATWKSPPSIGPTQ